MTALVQFAVICVAAQVVIAALVAHQAKCRPAEMGAFVAGALFRTALTWYYWHFTHGRSADARQYFHYADRAQFSLGGFLKPGTPFLCNLTAIFRPLADLFADPYLMAYVPFSVLGFCGSLLLYFVLRRFRVGSRRGSEPALLAFFLPNLIFWTSNLGKDSVAFFGICAITFALISLSMPRPFRVALGGIGAAALYLSRPHTVLFLVAGLAFGAFVERGVFTVRKGIVFAGALVAFILLFHPVSRYVGLRVDLDEDASPAQVVESYYDATMRRIEQGASSLATGGSAMERTSTNPLLAPVYLIQFLLGPFVWQARKPIQFLSAVENIIYQLMFVYLLVKWRAVLRAPIPPYKWSWILYILIAGALMGMTYTNFGLSVRQKCMVLPSLILIYAAARAHLETQRAAARAPVARESHLPCASS